MAWLIRYPDKRRTMFTPNEILLTFCHFAPSSNRYIAGTTTGGGALPEANAVRRDESAYYRICLLGMLDSTWSAMLGDMAVITERPGDSPCITTLSGHLADQAALMGVLNLAYDLGMVLLLVERETHLQTGAT